MQPVERVANLVNPHTALEAIRIIMFSQELIMCKPRAPQVQARFYDSKLLAPRTRRGFIAFYFSLYAQFQGESTLEITLNLRRRA